MIFITFVLILNFLLLFINLILGPHNPYKEKKTPFECGYHSFLEQTRNQFTISFYKFGFCFLVFDLEIVNIYPMGVSTYSVQGYGMATLLLFLILLTLGFVFELGKSALSIDTKQNNNLVLGNPVKSHNFTDTSLQSSIILSESYSTVVFSFIIAIYKIFKYTIAVCFKAMVNSCSLVINSICKLFTVIPNMIMFNSG